MRLLPAILAALGTFACAAPTMKARAPRPGAELLRVATYNVNYGLAGDPATVAAVEAIEADVLLLQETSREWEAALAALKHRYPYARFEHRPAAGGVAVMSAHPIEAVEVLEPSAEGGWFPALRAVVRTPAGPVQLMAVHLRPQVSDSGSVVSGYFSTPSIREAEMRGFVEVLDPNLPAVVAGDFNESATSGRATDFLRAEGFFDPLEAMQPGAITWRWPTSLGNLESGLDRIMVRAEAWTAIDTEVVDAGRSDHLPVVVTLERNSQVLPSKKLP